MHRVDDYRRNARDCRALAKRMPPAQRQQLLAMADQWDQIAEERRLGLDAEAWPAPDPGSDDDG